VCVGPVPNLSIALGVPYHDLNTVSADAQEKFFRKQYEEARQQYPDGERTLAVDEADMYFSQGARAYGCPALKEISNLGRNFYISQVYVARSPLDLSRNSRGLFNLLLIGRNTENRAAEWWEEFTGIEGFGTVLRDMPKYQFIAYDTNATPHILGVWSVENGEIVCRDWTPPEEETDPDGETEAEEGAPLDTGSTDAPPSPAVSASTPGAERPSPTGSASPTVTPTE
jgi:hypothetical protein